MNFDIDADKDKEKNHIDKLNISGTLKNQNNKDD